MAITVIQRPEEDLYVEENPTAYDAPYFTSRWNAANLPLTYKISNTKFPINTEDAIEDILTVSNNAGFAQLGLDAATYTFFTKGSVKITNTTNYNGVWKIRQVVNANTIVIDAPYVADETGNVQNYYDNYNVLVKVYAGLPEYHPSNAEKQMELITDNPIAITPHLNNEAVIDVAALVKSKMKLNNDYEVNDLDQFTALFISYAEQYDESNGIEVSTVTSAFVDDEIEGCDSSGSNFVTNGDFSDGFNNWVSEGEAPQINWEFFLGNNSAIVDLTSSDQTSQQLTQFDLGLTDGTEYQLSFNYIVSSGDSTRFTVRLGIDIIFQQIISGTNSISIPVIFSGTETGSFSKISFQAENISGAFNVQVDNISVVNSLLNPCLAYIFATHSALQPQSKYGANLGEYVQNFNGGVFENKWLTLMQQPVLFKGNYFDLSTLIPQSVIQSAIQSGGYFLEIVEFDINNQVIAENQYPITQNLGDGIYRFRIDDKTFQDNTKQFTVQILRIPVNLFVDGDQGTFDTTADPTGNPPSDWNLEKDSRAIINFEDTDVYEGAGALSFESRSIFNDNYAFNFKSSLTSIQPDKKAIILNQDNDLNFDQDFELEFEIYPKRVNYESAQEYFNRGSGNIRIAIIRDTSDLVVIWTDNSGNTRQLIRPVNVNQWNTVVFTFTQGMSANLNVNGSSVVNNTGIQISIQNGDDETMSLQFGGQGQVGGGDRVVFDGLHRNCKFTFNGVLVKEYKCNQEQGRQYWDSVNGEFSAICNNNYSDSEVQFNGGVWVDTTTL